MVLVNHLKVIPCPITAHRVIIRVLRKPTPTGWFKLWSSSLKITKSIFILNKIGVGDGDESVKSQEKGWKDCEI